MEKFQQVIDSWEEPVSCAFVVLMAHGDEGILMGEDGETVQLDDLFQVLNNKNCKALRAKPKVFIVQACRGGGAGQGTGATALHPARPCPAATPLTLPCPPPGPSVHKDLGETVGGDEVTLITNDGPYTIPTYTDFLHVYSTVEGRGAPLVHGSPSPRPLSPAPQLTPLYPQGSFPTDKKKMAPASSRHW